MTATYAWFLAGWARRLSWKKLDEDFRTTWDHVFCSVEMAVTWGRGDLVFTVIGSCQVISFLSRKNVGYLQLGILYYSTMKTNIRLIAFYLPQFHPIPENNDWWGNGFTEWFNTVKAKPLYRGHHQPNIPTNLGFYDLRLPESRIAQADLAREYGIEGFCYYHYWFAGKRLIERPFNEVLKSGEPDFPFCLCWANQTWSGIWHGSPDKILMEQTYPGMDDHKQHFYELLKAFCDSRYIMVDDKPVLVIYRPTEIPDIKKVLDYWRELAVKEGLTGLHIVGVSHLDMLDPGKSGLDAVIDQRLPGPNKIISFNFPYLKLQSLLAKKLPTIYSYDELVPNLVRTETPEFESYPCVIPNWDNTPRSGINGVVFEGVTLDLMRTQFERAKKRVTSYDDQHKLIFLKAWNEWAEGNYVEPDIRYGTRILELIRDVTRVP